MAPKGSAVAVQFHHIEDLGDIWNERNKFDQ